MEEALYLSFDRLLVMMMVGQGCKDAPGILQFLRAASYLSVFFKNSKLSCILVTIVFMLTTEHAKYAFKSHRNLLIPKYNRLHRSVPKMLRVETCLTVFTRTHNFVTEMQVFHN